MAELCLICGRESSVSRKGRRLIRMEEVDCIYCQGTGESPPGPRGAKPKPKPKPKAGTE